MTFALTVTIETAMAITDRRSKRTWMRRIEEGAVRQVGPDAGLQTLLMLEDVLPSAAIPFGSEVHSVLVQASMGHAEAQAELGQMLCLAGRTDLGAHWLQLAAARGSADAMQWLAVLAARGLGVPQSEAESLRWLRQAGQFGHAIARAQVEGLAARGRLSADWGAADAVRDKGEAETGNLWLAGEIRASIEDPRPNIPHAQVMVGIDEGLAALQKRN